jgi:hypothetical protein
MRLTIEQSRQVLAQHGSYTTWAYNKCGKLLSCVRYMCQGELGESVAAAEGAMVCPSARERRHNLNLYHPVETRSKWTGTPQSVRRR